MPGAGGHKFSRVLCTLPHIHWYSSKANGINPWNVSNPITDKRKISRYDFDSPYTMINRTNNGAEWLSKLGFNEHRTFEKLKELGLTDNQIQFTMRNDITWQEFKDIPKPDKWVVIPTHREPKEIYEHYPDSKIIYLSNHLEVCTQRTVDIVTKYQVKDIIYVKDSYTSPANPAMYLTYKDLWALKHYNSHYKDWHKDRFYKHIAESITVLDENCKLDGLGLKVDMTKRKNWKEIKEYINE